MAPGHDTSPGASDDPGVQAVAAHASDLIADGARVGLGSGRASAAFIARLGARVREGLNVSGVPTSPVAAALARTAGIPLIDLDEHVELDLTVDGADEVGPGLDLVKGWGGALVRERIVASASRRQVIMVGPEKLVSALGERGRIPVEVIPFAAGTVTRALERMGITPTIRMDSTGRRRLVNENSNLTFDCRLATPLRDGPAARELEAALLAVAGVVDTGLFLGTAERVLVGHPDGRVETLLCLLRP